MTAQLASVDPVPAAPKRWTRERVIECIQDWTREFGEPPKMTDWNPAKAKMHMRAALAKAHSWTERVDAFETGEWPSGWTAQRLFGTFNAAIEAAGIESRPGGRTPRDLDERRLARLRKEGDLGPIVGPSQLALGIKGVMEARAQKNKAALRGSLLHLAATAVAWSDQLEQEMNVRRTA